jgi:NAD-dependent dihydropyrimidine dehydrogenase PreA subunit
MKGTTRLASPARKNTNWGFRAGENRAERTLDPRTTHAGSVDCIHPHKEETVIAERARLYIDPDACIDCGAYIPECPMSAIFSSDDTPKRRIRVMARRCARRGSTPAYRFVRQVRRTRAKARTCRLHLDRRRAGLGTAVPSQQARTGKPRAHLRDRQNADAARHSGAP